MDKNAQNPPPQRLPALDIARGTALVAMVIYHFGWDLAALKLIEGNLQQNTLWQAFGHTIAASFLVLSGMALHLAQGAGFNTRTFLSRLALVAGSAMLVSGATYLVFPERFIFFGILHLLALGAVLALPFLRAPLVLVVAAAGALFVVPFFVQSPALSSSWLIWLGLGDEVPLSHDFVPVFPWFGFMLAGVALGRLGVLARFRAPPPQGQPAQLLGQVGRKSLLIYLLHQPVLYGGLWLLAQAGAPPLEREAQGFMAACTSECRSAGGESARCTAVCTCAVGALKADGLWADVLANKTGPAQAARLAQISQTCAIKAQKNP